MLIITVKAQYPKTNIDYTAIFTSLKIVIYIPLCNERKNGSVSKAPVLRSDQNIKTYHK